MEKAGKKAASSSQKFEIDKLKEAMEQQKAEIDRLRWLLDNIGKGNLSFLSFSCGVARRQKTSLPSPLFLTDERSCSELWKFILGE